MSESEFHSSPTNHIVAVPVAAHCKSAVAVDYGEMIQIIAGQSNPDGFQIVTSFCLTRSEARGLAQKILEYADKKVH